MSDLTGDPKFYTRDPHDPSCQYINAWSHRLSQEVRRVAEVYFEGEKAEAIIATVLGAVAMARWTSLEQEQFCRIAGGCP